MRFHKIFTDVLADGGATVSNTAYVVPASGYVVADGQREAKVNIDDFDPYVIEEYVLENDDTLSIFGVCFGAWHNEDNGIVYLDCVVIFDDEESAAVVAKQRGEISYYDIAKGVTVNV